MVYIDVYLADVSIADAKFDWISQLTEVRPLDFADLKEISIEPGNTN